MLAISFSFLLSCDHLFKFKLEYKLLPAGRYDSVSIFATGIIPSIYINSEGLTLTPTLARK
jgi:hypothetical protein